MNEKRVEELLREYAKHRPEERLFSEQVARRLRSRLKAGRSADLEEGQPGHPDNALPSDRPQSRG